MQVEKALIKDPEHLKKYEEFMDDYLNLVHMNPIPLSEQSRSWEVPITCHTISSLSK